MATNNTSGFSGMSCEEWLKYRDGKFSSYQKVLVVEFIFVIFALVSSCLLAVVLFKFERLRRSFRFYIAVICILDIIMAVVFIISRSLYIHIYSNFNYTPDSASFRLAFSVIFRRATEKTLEAASCFLLTLTAAELYIEMCRKEFRHKLKIRYGAAAIALILAFLLEGERFPIVSGFITRSK